MSGANMRAPVINNTAARGEWMREMGQRIRQLREGAGLRQMDVAAAISTQPKTLSAIEGGATTPSAWQLALLAEVLDCTIDELVPVTTLRLKGVG